MTQIFEKFLRKRKQAKNYPAKYQDVFDGNQLDLMQYIKTGALPGDYLPPAELQIAPWETFSELLINASYYEILAEAEFVTEDRINYPYLVQAMSYSYFYSAMRFYNLQRFQSRFGRDYDAGISPNIIFNLCLAELAGVSLYSQRLFSFFKQGYVRNWFNRSNSHLSDAIILLYAAYLGQPMEPTVGQFAYKGLIAQFAYKELIADWDTTDLQKVSSLLQQLCDDQMLQVVAPPSKFFIELGNMNWQFIPYPALLLMKLRQNRGLANPQFEHPGFGALNPLLISTAVPLVIDDTLAAVLDRARLQGFDDEAIFAAGSLGG
ncbi:MAG: hypothetical protein KJ556_08780 [Gammaproteobacteria bacterium]|nr:hypothetical protein [Gammaproteobacteria bacterium]MBU2059414.1 hypothetical protein [Gammaproteobacteria bacterium]MBU2175206.1 hypothetical protein [Gammaproteobacteria bacterium]MBU2247414.1 hypothetical protein [Gammaproteobacteria bacterium]MBU2346319.1 hypothetical protein [Gammaproteobacteria bacterium]